MYDGISNNYFCKDVSSFTIPLIMSFMYIVCINTGQCNIFSVRVIYCASCNQACVRMCGCMRMCGSA